MKSDQLRYGLVLAIVLTLLFVIGNLVNSSPRTLSVFPWFSDLFAFPVVLYPAIKAIGIKRYGTSLTLRQGLRIGEAISRWAALLFGVFSASYGYFYFGYNGPGFTTFVLTVAVTWLMGVLVSLLCVLVILRRLPPYKPSSAATNGRRDKRGPARQN